MSFRPEEELFLREVEYLRGKQPRNYVVKEINLYNQGKDAVDQEITIIGNVLQVLDFPDFREIYIKFNQTSNEAIRLRKGIFALTFFCFFLTYNHTNQTDKYNKPYLLKILVGRDIVCIQYPSIIEKSYFTLSEGETFDIDLALPPLTLFGSLPCEFALSGNYFDIRKYSQIKGIVANQATSGVNYFYIRQYFLYYTVTQIIYDTKILLPLSYNPIPFIVDIIAPFLQFCIERDTAHSLVIYLYAKAC